jgi:hypothetical protein
MMAYSFTASQEKNTISHQGTKAQRRKSKAFLLVPSGLSG